VKQAFLRYIKKPFLKQLKENLASNNSMLKLVQGQLHEICDLLTRFTTIIDDIETCMNSPNCLLVPSPLKAERKEQRLDASCTPHPRSSEQRWRIKMR